MKLGIPIWMVLVAHIESWALRQLTFCIPRPFQTTLLAMLTGMTPVTGGSAFIVGRDVVEDMSNIRNSLGVCPQHDILYPTLTVREHLRLYAVLKGVPHAVLEEAIEVCSFSVIRVQVETYNNAHPPLLDVSAFGNKTYVVTQGLHRCHFSVLHGPPTLLLIALFVLLTDRIG